MHWWYNGAPGGWGIAGMILMIAFWIAVIVGIVFLIRWLAQQSRKPESGRSSALDILKERYARGEISREDFERMKKDIS